MALEENGGNKIVGESNKLMGKKRTLLKNILRRKSNWIGHVLMKNCFLHDAIEGKMTEVKGVGRRRKVPRLFKKQKKILGAKGESLRTKKLETTVQSNIKKKYKLSFLEHIHI